MNFNLKIILFLFKFISTTSTSQFPLDSLSLLTFTQVIHKHWKPGNTISCAWRGKQPHSIVYPSYAKCHIEGIYTIIGTHLNHVPVFGILIHSIVSKSHG